MSTPNKNLGKVEIRLKWDPSPLGEAAHDLDLIAADLPVDDPHGSPRLPGALRQPAPPTAPSTSSRDSRTGRGSASTRS